MVHFSAGVRKLFQQEGHTASWATFQGPLLGRNRGKSTWSNGWNSCLCVLGYIPTMQKSEVAVHISLYPGKKERKSATIISEYFQTGKSTQGSKAAERGGPGKKGVYPWESPNGQRDTRGPHLENRPRPESHGNYKKEFSGTLSFHGLRTRVQFTRCKWIWWSTVHETLHHNKCPPI